MVLNKCGVHLYSSLVSHAGLLEYISSFAEQDADIFTHFSSQSHTVGLDWEYLWRTLNMAVDFDWSLLTYGYFHPDSGHVSKVTVQLKGETPSQVFYQPLTGFFLGSLHFFF